MLWKANAEVISEPMTTFPRRRSYDKYSKFDSLKYAGTSRVALLRKRFMLRKGQSTHSKRVKRPPTRARYMVDLWYQGPRFGPGVAVRLKIT